MPYAEQTVATCDAPDCGKSAVVKNDVLPTAWWEGTVRNDADEAIDWIACRPTHLKAAVEAAAEKKKDHA